jgi:DNA-binding transcriptional MocR family regulator
MQHTTEPSGLAERLAAQVVERIKTHVYAGGVRLPSVRASASAQGVSPATVVAAYDRLVAQGWIEARPQRGFFVRADGGGAALGPSAPANFEPKTAPRPFLTPNPPSVSGSITSVATKNEAYSQRADLYTTAAQPTAAAPPVPAPTHATALIRGMFRPRNALPQPSMGVLPTEWLDTRFLASALRHVTSSPADRRVWTEYGDPAGDAQLRQALAQRLAGYGVRCDAQQIITTVGATHALDIASRTLLRAGDAVMVEEPGWTVEFARLSALGFRILPVPRGPQGPDLEVMRRYCEAPAAQDRPRLFVSVSVLHNPTGACLSPAAAHQVLQLAHAHGFHILEDDTYAHFAPDHATRLAALDGLSRVIYIGGFAKALAPNWRVGYIAAPAHWVEALVDTKMLSTLTTPAMLERALAHVMAQGQLRKHCERIKTSLAAARNRSVKHALAHGCSFAAEPSGLFGWVDVGADTDALAPKLLDHGYLIAPGGLFYAQRRPSSLMRINFSTTQAPEFWQALDACRSK